MSPEVTQCPAHPCVGGIVGPLFQGSSSLAVVSVMVGQRHFIWSSGDSREKKGDRLMLTSGWWG